MFTLVGPRAGRLTTPQLSTCLCFFSHCRICTPIRSRCMRKLEVLRVFLDPSRVAGLNLPHEPFPGPFRSDYHPSTCQKAPLDSERNYSCLPRGLGPLSRAHGLRHSTDLLPVSHFLGSAGTARDGVVHHVEVAVGRVKGPMLLPCIRLSGATLSEVLWLAGMREYVSSTFSHERVYSSFPGELSA
ncbi:hypothetical protein B0H34DRAFT_720499 [Crassisporium funariophilum]|nr:hypothetical protein B0H34DRAFT_720499 [Crassisporium funariophilum]